MFSEIFTCTPPYSAIGNSTFKYKKSDSLLSFSHIVSISQNVRRSSQSNFGIWPILCFFASLQKGDSKKRNHKLKASSFRWNNQIIVNSIVNTYLGKAIHSIPFRTFARGDSGIVSISNLTRPHSQIYHTLRCVLHNIHSFLNLIHNFILKCTTCLKTSFFPKNLIQLPPIGVSLDGPLQS